MFKYDDSKSFLRNFCEFGMQLENGIFSDTHGSHWIPWFMVHLSPMWYRGIACNQLMIPICGIERGLKVAKVADRKGISAMQSRSL